MSVILKYIYLLRLSCRGSLRKWLGRKLPARPALLSDDQGNSLPFLEGANLPWLVYGGDFGANAWRPSGGMSRPGKRDELRRHLAALRRKGLRSVRWFLFCDGRAGIRFNANGTPLGPDESLFADIDAALEEAAAGGMKVIFVLLDFLWFAKASTVSGVQTGGRSRTVSGPYRQRLLRRRVLRPLLERYGGSPAILAWDIINEPEWATRGWGGGIVSPAISFTTMRRFIKRVARLVHRRTGHLATVGLANATTLPLTQGCGLDFYQVHWYERWQKVAPLERPVAEFRLDRPLLLGEFPTKGSSRSRESIVAAARNSGYCGALAWSWLARDEFSGIDGKT